MGFFSDVVDNTVGSVTDVVQAPAKTISSGFDHVAAVVDNPVFSPINYFDSTVIKKFTGISPGQQLMIGAAGGAVGTGLGIGASSGVVAPTLGTIGGAAGGIETGGAVAGVGTIGAIHEGVKPVLDIIKPPESPVTTSNPAPVAPGSNNTPILLMAGLIAAKILLF